MSDGVCGGDVPPLIGDVLTGVGRRTTAPILTGNGPAGAASLLEAAQPRFQTLGEDSHVPGDARVVVAGHDFDGDHGR